MVDARWSPVEQRTLVEFWADEAVQIALNSMVHNREVYQGIAVNMAYRGFERTAQQCQNKLKLLRKKYSETEKHNARSGVSPKTFPGYDVMRTVLATRELHQSSYT